MTTTSTIVLAMGITAASSVAGSIARGRSIPPATIGVGAFAAGAMLLIVASWAPTLAAGVATLVAVAALVRNGTDLARLIRTATT